MSDIRSDTELLDRIEREIEGTGKAVTLGGSCYWSATIGRKRVGEGSDLREALDDWFDAIDAERRREVTAKAIANFERSLALRPPMPPPGSDIDPRLWDLEREAMESEVADLRAQLAETP